MQEISSSIAISNGTCAFATSSSRRKNSANSSIVKGRIELPCDSIQSISLAFLSDLFVASSSIAIVAVLTSSLHSSGTCAWETAMAARKMTTAPVSVLLTYSPRKEERLQLPYDLVPQVQEHARNTISGGLLLTGLAQVTCGEYRRSAIIIASAVATNSRRPRSTSVELRPSILCPVSRVLANALLLIPFPVGCMARLTI